MHLQEKVSVVAKLLPIGLVVALALTGCSYIGQGAFEEKRATLDHDKDGAPYDGANKDCDDFDANVSPDFEEIPYDGHDNDCQGGDVVDADGDGFPGITEEAYLANNPEATWPDSVATGPLDCADDLAVFANARDIFPSNPNDVPYDGIDSDCGGENDFDDDGDGYMPDEVILDGATISVSTAYDTYIAAWGYDFGTPAFGDCDDEVDDIHPGRPLSDDVPYDGEDTNCDGLNDFDLDGDGFMPEQNTYEGLFDDFVGRFHNGIAPWPIEWGDCLDNDTTVTDQSGAPVLGADVFPGNDAGDVWYDGIDSNCAGDNDYDQDADGVMILSDSGPNQSAIWDEYEATWNTGLVPTYNDCVDDNPLAYPGALELIGDNADSDCDGDIDGTPFGFDSLLWDSPRPPRVDVTDNHYVLVTSADQVDVGVSQPLHIAAALTFELSAGYEATTTDSILWLGLSNALPLGNALDVAANGDSFWGSASYVFDDANGYISSKRMMYNSGLQGYVQDVFKWSLVDNAYTGLAVDLVLDDNGEPWSVSCGIDTVQAIHGLAADTTTHDASLAPSFALPAGVPGGMCFWDSVPDAITGIGQLVLCDTADCVMYDFDINNDTMAISATQNWTGTQLTYATHREGYHHVIDAAPGAAIMGPMPTIDVLTDYWLDSVDADWRDIDGDGDDDFLYVVGVGEPVVDDGQGPRVILAYGNPAGVLTEQVIPYVDPLRPNLVPAAASIHTDESRLFIGVSGTDASAAFQDSVGWVFFGWSP